MTDWSQRFPDKPVQRSRNFSDHKWEDTTQGWVCTECKRPWSAVLGESSKPCYSSNHNKRTLAQMEAERDWLWSTIVDAVSAGT